VAEDKGAPPRRPRPNPPRKPAPPPIAEDAFGANEHTAVELRVKLGLPFEPPDEGSEDPTPRPQLESARRSDLGAVAARLSAAVPRPGPTPPAPRLRFIRHDVERIELGIGSLWRELLLAGVFLALVVAYGWKKHKETPPPPPSPVYVLPKVRHTPTSWADVPTIAIVPSAPAQITPKGPIVAEPLQLPPRAPKPDPALEPPASSRPVKYFDVKRVTENFKKQEAQKKAGYVPRPRTSSLPVVSVPDRTPDRAPQKTLIKREVIREESSEPIPKDRTSGPSGQSEAHARGEHAMLSILSSPPGAKVTLDGKSFGKTPLVRPAPPGKPSFSVRIELKKRKWTGTLTPDASGNFNLKVNLAK
jgi:hypothetical protein